jgi:hypothetical protein
MGIYHGRNISIGGQVMDLFNFIALFDLHYMIPFFVTEHCNAFLEETWRARKLRRPIWIFFSQVILNFSITGYESELELIMEDDSFI